MEQLNIIQVGNFPLIGKYGDQDADRIMAELRTHVSNEIKKIPVYEPPQLQVIEGGRK